MRAKDCGVGHIVRIRSGPQDVVYGHQEVVKGLLRGHDGRRREWSGYKARLLEMIVDHGRNDTYRVTLVEVQIPPYPRPHSLWNVGRLQWKSHF